MRIAVEIGMHPNEEAESQFGSKLSKSFKEKRPKLRGSTTAIDIFRHNQDAVDLGVRQVDFPLERSFPGIFNNSFRGEEFDIAFDIQDDYTKGNYDSKIAIHHNRYPNGRHVFITPDGSFKVSKRSLAIASLLETRRVVLCDGPYHQSVGFPGALDYEIPLCQPRNANRQIEVYRRKFEDLALRNIDDLPDVHLPQFTFFTLTTEIPRKESEELGLDEFKITRRFQQLPHEAVRRLGFEGKAPYYAMSWNYNNFSTTDAEGRRTMFGAVVRRGAFDYVVRKGFPNLLAA